MSFTWTKVIGVNNLSTAEAVQEVRDNTDYLKDNPTCLSHNSTVYSTHYTLNDYSQYAGLNSSYLTGYCSTNDQDYVSYEGGHWDVAKTYNNTGYLLNTFYWNCVTNFGTQNVAVNPTVNQSHVQSYCGGQ